MRAKMKWRDDELVTCDEEFRHALAEAEQDAARLPLIAEVTLDEGDCVCPSGDHLGVVADLEPPDHAPGSWGTITF